MPSPGRIRWAASGLAGRPRGLHHFQGVTASQYPVPPLVLIVMARSRALSRRAERAYNHERRVGILCDTLSGVQTLGGRRLERCSSRRWPGRFMLGMPLPQGCFHSASQDPRLPDCGAAEAAGRATALRGSKRGGHLAAMMFDFDHPSCVDIDCVVTYPTWENGAPAVMRSRQ